MKDDRAKQTAGRLFDSEKHCGDLADNPRFRVLSDEKIERIHEAQR
ncbi:MAG: hypothetical protein V3U95_05255 [Dehalococcoidia bacterium]